MINDVGASMKIKVTILILEGLAAGVLRQSTQHPCNLRAPIFPKNNRLRKINFVLTYTGALLSVMQFFDCA
jgi:hypothetical protein